MFVFTTYDLLRANLCERGDQVYLLEGNRSLTYRELASRCHAIAAWLYEHGVRRGDRVGLFMRKSSDEVAATLAVAQVGAVFVNINAQWTTGQLEYIADDCDIRLLITDGRGAKQLERDQKAKRFDRILVASGNHSLPNGDEPVADTASVPVARVVDQDLAALLYTSGSTGKPKGVMITHRNLVDGAKSVSTYLGLTADDRLLSLLPLSFDYGLNQLTSSLLVGGSLVLQPVAMPSAIVDQVNQHGVTGLAAVPPAWIQLMRYLDESEASLPSLRYVTNSGGKIPPTTLDLMDKHLSHTEIFLMYGLTEAFRSTYLDPQLFREKMGAMGRAIPNVETFVIDPERGVCGPNEPGELVHRGALISLGYWGQPQATAEKLRCCPHLQDLIGDEKVLFSGDIVYRDEDDILWFVERNDSMIKCSGYRLSPTEVEDLVYQFTGVNEVVAFGVQSDELGQEVHIAVTAKPNVEWTVDDLLAHCRGTMPNYMVPRQVHVFDEPFPRTASGKLDRPAIVERARSSDVSA